jgi:hypothetical protein
LEPVSPTNLAAFAAVLVAATTAPAFMRHGANDECTTPNVNTGDVAADPCGEYPGSKEWNCSDLGGTGTLWNYYASGYFNENICINPGDPVQRH